MFIFFGLIVDLVLSLLSKRVQFKGPEPFNTEANYGLFQKCSTLTGDCRRFPQKSWGDCDHDNSTFGEKSGRYVNLCLEWRVAAGVAVASSIVGLWVLALLGTVLYAGDRWHANGWKYVLGPVGVFGKTLFIEFTSYYHLFP